MPSVILQHPTAGFSGYARAAGRGFFFSAGFTSLVELTAAQVTALTNMGFGVNGSAPAPVPDPFPQYVLDAELAAALAALPGAGNASTTISGVVELATNTEATTGTDTSRAVTPAAMVAAVKAQLGNPASEIGTAGRVAFLPRWTANTAYAQGDLVLSPAGATVQAKAAFTSGSTYSATNWTVVSGGVSSDAAKQFTAVPMASTSDLNLKRYGTGAPVFTVAGQVMASGKTAADSAYWPCLIDARATIGASALDNWYMLFSTDHDTGGGGIFLATAPHWSGPWTGQGRVYVDTVSGTQSETPTAVYKLDDGLFYVLYQNYGVTGANGAQTTVLATSPTLLAGSFTRVGIAIDIPPDGAIPGNGHTGYASVHSDGGVFYAYHLMGGGNPSLAGFSQSVDMRTWFTDTRPLTWGMDQVGDEVRRIAWGGTQVVRWKGDLWAIGTLTNGASGTDPKDGRVFTARLSPDRRHIIGRPRIQLFPVASAAGESTNYRSCFATVTSAGELVVMYQCDDSFFVATAA